MTRVPWWIHEKDVMFAMSRASNGGSTEGTQALLRHTVLDQTQPVLAYITGVIFSRFQASGGKRGASLRSWRDKWECCSLPRAQESRHLRRLTRSERGTPDTLDGGRHQKNNAVYFFSPSFFMRVSGPLHSLHTNLGSPEKSENLKP